MKKTAFLLLLICLCVWLSAGMAEEDTKGKRRALLMAYDVFAVRESMAPSATNNVAGMRGILESDSRGYDRIHEVINRYADFDSVKQQVNLAFSDSRPDDVNVIYLFSHGEIYENDGGTFRFVFSDGKEDWHCDIATLYRLFEDVKGTKILVLDACYGGAVINKGTRDIFTRTPFMRPDWFVFTAAGGEELTYTWSSAWDQTAGGSYLMLALRQGLTEGGRYRADRNRDGKVTWQELLHYVRAHQGTSTAQAYPQTHDLVVLACAKKQAKPYAVTDIEYDTFGISGQEQSFDFAYTQHEAASIAYQLVYERDGVWLFDAPQLERDIKEGEADKERGRMERQMRLFEGSERYGYMIFSILKGEGEALYPLATTLIAKHDDALQHVRLEMPAQVNFNKGEELPVLLWHQRPCLLSVTVRNLMGDAAAHPVINEPSRPIGFDGTALYLTGVDDDGILLPKGKYWLEILVQTGSRVQAVYSPVFEVL